MKKEIYTIGNSQEIILKKSILEDAKFKTGDEIICYISDGRIILEKNEQSFQNRWENFISDGGIYNEEEINWGDDPLGREL